MKSKPTILAIKIQPELRRRIKAAATRDGRNESSFARHYLAKAADEISPPPVVATSNACPTVASK